jgi:mannosyltransferase OCH1-like enzyme
MRKISNKIIFENKQVKPIVVTKINSIPFPNKKINEYDIQIPANIFQTWHTKNLPPIMFKAVVNIKKNNPRFNYYLFDDNDCREFIKNNFNEKILNAYDSLIPGAYKADLWRYCILYKYGGIYLDIKYIPVNGFKFINLLEQEHWPLDINKTNIYNALLVCKPGNQILFKAINQIVENVKNKYYGLCYLSPTGPELLSRFFSEYEKKTFQIYHELMGNNDFDKIIKFNNHTILRVYPGYIRERDSYSKVTHYSILWNNKKIYL